MREKYSVRAGPVTWTAYCDDSLGDLAQQLLQDFALKFLGLDLKDESRIQFGFSALIVRILPDEVRLMQPNYFRDPLREVEDDITTTLLITAEQVGFINRTGMSNRDDLPPYFARMVVRKGALEQEHVYLQRSPSTRTEDSGWFLGLVAEGESDVVLPKDAYQVIYLYQLIEFRPALLRVLGLPAGSVVVFRGDEIEEAVDDHGEVIWPLPEEPGAN